MRATIAKRFTFHAAHRLPHHDGPCRDLHGHSYVLEVAVTGRVKAPNGDPDEGMVLDFTELKRIYAEKVEPFVEHKFLNETLVGRLVTTVVEHAMDVSIPPYDEPLTTCENIAMWIHGEFSNELVNGHLLPQRQVTVRLWETPTSFAEVGDVPFRKE